jgi:hypothetical protein
MKNHEPLSKARVTNALRLPESWFFSWSCVYNQDSEKSLGSHSTLKVQVGGTTAVEKVGQAT